MAFRPISTSLLAVLALAACGSAVVTAEEANGPLAEANTATTKSRPATTPVPTTSTSITSISTTTTMTPTTSTTTTSTTSTSTTSTTSTTTTTTLPPPTTEPPETVTVDITDISFEPGTITITVGDKVRWRNQGIIEHTATGSFWDTGAIESGGKSSTVTFDQVGSFEYVCVFHSIQTGTIVVQEP